MVNVNDNPDDTSMILSQKSFWEWSWWWYLSAFFPCDRSTHLSWHLLRHSAANLDYDRKILIVMMVDYVGNGYDNVSYLLRSSLALLLGDLLALAPLELLALILLVRHLKEQTRYTCSAQTTPCCILRDTAYCTMGLSRPTSTLNFFTFWSTHSVLGTVLHSEVRTSFGTFTFFFLATSLHSFKQQHWY